MDKEQKLEWDEAQKIVISEDLVDAAKKQLKFLATVDKNRCLYDGPVLERAIYRYKTCWLPLLAKSEIADGGLLVVPLDCEWIWHCHRLNPLRYKADCEEFYGKILDNKHVVSTVQGGSKKETEEIWNRLYPAEPYELDLSHLSDTILENLSECTSYDFVLAVKRQSPFFYQVSRPIMNEDVFLEEAVARYKGFLHMIKRNKERSIKRFCVPTYDIDVIWHSHQLHPVSYCKDLVEVLGQILEHDDTDSDRTKGQKLDTGFSGTTMHWENTFGSRYWIAGGMYRGVAPSPVTVIPLLSKIESKTVVSSTVSQKLLQLPKMKAVEVFLEIVGVKNLPEGHNGSLFVFFSKKNPDAFFDQRRRLSILSESREKQVASFQCEPTGELFFELLCHSSSNLPISRPAKILGTTTVSLSQMLDPVSKFSVESWFELVSCSGTLESMPICLRIAVSVTPPAPAPHELHMVRSRPFLSSSCFFPVHGKSWTSVVDQAGNEIINIQLRDSKNIVAGNNLKSKKEVIGIVGYSDETRVLAEFSERGWCLTDFNWSSQLQKKSRDDCHFFELRGNHMVLLFPGRKLDYEPKYCQTKKNEGDFMTAVEFSKSDPYGKAIALFNLKSGVLKVDEDWFALSAITLAFVLSDIWRKEGSSAFFSARKNSNVVSLTESDDVESRKIQGTFLEKDELAEKGSLVLAEKGENKKCGDKVKNDVSSLCYGNVVKNNASSLSYGNVVKSNASSLCYGNVVKNNASSFCGGGSCANGYGNVKKNDASSVCGGGSCASGYGNVVKSEICDGSETIVKGGGCGGDCGGGCGGGCGNMVKSGGCGGGCGGGGGCGNMVRSGAGGR